MSILTSLTSAVEGVPGAGPTSPVAGPGAQVISQVISLIQSRPGGLGGLLQSFQQGGLGHLFQSWVGTGQNLPVSPEQLRAVLGSDWVARAAQATGLPPEQLEQHLSSLLPKIIDHLSPNGQLLPRDPGSALADVVQHVLHG